MYPAVYVEFEALEMLEVEFSSIWSNVLEVVAPVFEVSSVVELGFIPPIACRAFCAFVCNVAKALCAAERLPELSASETDFKSSVNCFGAVTPLEDRLF